MWRMPSPPRRLLIVRNDRVGDLMLTLPAIEAARRNWPDAYLAVLASPVAASLLEGYPGIDEIIVDRPHDTARQLADRLRTGRFDTAVVAHTTWRNWWGVTLAGIGRKIGWGGKLPGLLLASQRVMVSRKNPPLHEAQFVMKLMQPLGVEGNADDYEPRLHIAPELVRSIQRDIHDRLGTEGPLFGVNPSHFRGAYNWPVHRYADLIAGLANYGRVLVTVGPHEISVLEQIEQRWQATGAMPPERLQRVALVSNFDLKQLAAAISLVDVFTVGNTGPMHMAGVLQTPLVALFSTDPSQAPARWRPLGNRRVMLLPPLPFEADPKVAPENAEAHMCQISVAQVIDANLMWLKWHSRNKLQTTERQAA